MVSITTATANQNEMLDALVWRIFKKGAPLIEQVMELNPELAGHVFLPEGTIVKLPEIANQKPILPSINLWD